jgi:hypothetical protein
MTKALLLQLILAVPAGILPAQAAPPAPPPLDSVLKPVHWRSIGPFRGGRSVASTGVPGDPKT